MAGSRGIFTVDNRREYSVSILPRGGQRSSLLPLLFVACICLGGVVWLASRAERDTSPSELLLPLPVSPLPTSISEPLPQPALIVNEEPVAEENKPAAQKPVEPRLAVEEPKPVAASKSMALKSPVVPEKKVGSTAKPNAVNWKKTPENYTAQLMAAYSEQGVKRIQAKLPVTTPSTIHKTLKDGKPWFILVYGSFATKQEALRAQARLPDSIRSEVKPWVRKQGEIFAQ